MVEMVRFSDPMMGSLNTVCHMGASQRLKEGGRGNTRARCSGTEEVQDTGTEEATDGRNGKGGTAKKGGGKSGRKDDDHPGYGTGRIDRGD